MNTFRYLLPALAVLSFAPLTQASYTSDVLATPGLQGYWRLGETSGSTIADSKGTHPGSISGGASLNVAGAITGDSNGGMAFNGSTGVATIANGSACVAAATGNTPLSIEGWIKISNASPSAAQRFFGFSNGANPSLYVEQSANDNRLHVFFQSSGGSWTHYTPAVTLNVWHHLVFAYNGNGLIELYYDKQLVSSEIGVQGQIRNTTTALTIGAVNGVYGSASVDEVALYNTCLDVDSVKQHYQDGSGQIGRTPNTIGRYMGNWVAGSTNHRPTGASSNVYTFDPVDNFAAEVGGMPAMIMWYKNSGDGGFDRHYTDMARSRDAVPMITYMTASSSQPATSYSLSAIIAGNHDAEITHYAQGLAAWAHPVFVRLDHEMNGTWYPWSPGNSSNPGNTAAQYVQMWQHVWNLFQSAGANAYITWVWCPNIILQFGTPTSMSSLYPGDAYVNWIGLDAYNGGTWQTAFNLLSSSYTTITGLTAKPLMLGELGSEEQEDGNGNVLNNGAAKGAWITDCYLTQMTAAFPRITGIVWFDEAGSQLWNIDSSPDSLAAYQDVVASPVWSSGTIYDEGELLSLAASSGKTNRIVQAGSFSAGSAVIYDSSAINDYVTYYVYAPAGGTYTVKLGTKLNAGRGIFQLAVASSVGGSYTNHGSPVDLYAAADTYTATTVDTNCVFSSAGLKAFRFTITGKNASSSGYNFCADYIQLLPH